MFLEKLELQGFKSFANRTMLEFSPGITAIVGPNGSGKSNIADAIRWVLGEQSMKTLRGKKSEDVIFAGTKAKSRMGMAEVSLFLNNEDGQMPIDFSHVVITRRLFRNGESEYLINKNKVRLLDIQELLAKAGFGQKTYSVIGQGMIDAFLKAGPKERRELFEEAAGIKQFQIKKNISLNKLENTKNNLTRVQDLLNEILPRVRSLKRQANRAAKKEEVKKELVDLQMTYFNYHWNDIQKQIKANGAKASEAKRAEQEIQRELDEISEKLDRKEEITSPTNTGALQEELNVLHQEKNQLEEKLAILRGRIQVEKERKYKVDVSAINREIEAIGQESRELKSKLEQVSQDLAGVTQSLQAKNSGEEEILEKINNLQERIKESSEKEAASDGANGLASSIRSLYSKQESFLDELKACENLEQLNNLKIKGEELRLEAKNLLVKAEQLGDDSPTNTADLASLQSELSELLNSRAALEKELSEQKIKSAVLTTQQSNLNDQTRNKESYLAKLKERLRKATEGEEENIITSELTEEEQQVQNKILSINGSISKKEETYKEETAKAKEAQESNVGLEKGFREKQFKLNELKDKHREIEVDAAKIDTSKGLLKDEITDNFGEERFNELTQKFLGSPVELDSAKDLETKDKIRKLGNHIAQIGEIDPEVLKEHEETSKRYTFLFTQKEDLQEASKSLKKIIGELDKTISDRFDDALKNINVQFQKYFEILFAGGKAKLVKHQMKERAPLAKKHSAAEIEGVSEKELRELEKGKEERLAHESFIEIKANPPGKKLKDLNMLSGGERALTSIALILAIIANNPSPFITLDEVDAALDEANSVKYGRIIESVANMTQFITITHNRETMRKAKVLYGVTMAEDGVSKLLSVKLDEAEKHVRE